MPPTSEPLLGHAPRGTPWYYATLHLPPEQRRDLLALQAWWRALRALPLSVSDAGVAGAKLAWWQAQLRSCAQGRPDHPLLQQLQPALQATPQALEQLQRALDHIDAELRQSRWIDWRGVLAHLDTGPGAVARAAALLGGAAQAQDWAAALGVALARVAMLRDIGRDLRHGVIRLPVEALAAHQVKAQQLLALEDSPELRALLRAAGAEARAALAAAHALRPRERGGIARSGAALHRGALLLLGEMERADYDLLGQRIMLPPLRLLWTSWRAR